jgi:hypothetical protein
MVWVVMVVLMLEACMVLGMVVVKQCQLKLMVYLVPLHHPHNTQVMVCVKVIAILVSRSLSNLLELL